MQFLFKPSHLSIEDMLATIRLEFEYLSPREAAKAFATRYIAAGTHPLHTEEIIDRLEARIAEDRRGRFYVV